MSTKTYLLTLLVVAACRSNGNSADAASPISFWDQPEHGANCFNGHVSAEYFKAAKAAGLDVLRLTFTKWPSRHRDFLIGNADRYDSLITEDLSELKRVLDLANSSGVKIVLVPLSLPGARWRQQNGDQFDLRLWKDKKYWDQCARFWKDLAVALKGHRALVGYNLLNEPIPEKLARPMPTRDNIAQWYQHQESTAADLNAFNQKMVTAIREVDSTIPLIIDAGLWAGTDGFQYLEPVADKLVVYSFHVYDPWEFTNKKANGGKLAYPGDSVPNLCSAGDRTPLGRPLLECLVEPVVNWQKRFGIPSNRVFAGEFGCNRTSRGAAAYLADLMDIFNQHGWHWAFYSFREDTWDGMDYEVGTKPLGWKYWQAKERGEDPPIDRSDNPLWRVIADRLDRKQQP